MWTVNSSAAVRKTLARPSSISSRATASSKRAAAESHGLISVPTDGVASRIIRTASAYIVALNERHYTYSSLFPRILLPLNPHRPHTYGPPPTAHHPPPT